MPTRTPKLQIVIDTQEVSHGHAWVFPRTKATSIVRNLIPRGCDYTVGGYTGVIGVERKSHGDYVRCIGKDWARFRRQLEKLEKHKHCLVLVEGNMNGVIPYSNFGHGFVGFRTMQIVTRGIPVVFAGNAQLAQKVCWDFFKQAIKRLENEIEISYKARR